MIFSIALLAIGFVSCDKIMNADKKVTCCKQDDCCKNCDDEECKTTCEAVSKLSSEEATTEKGKELIQKCKTLCDKNDCCDKASKCEKSDMNACCNNADCYKDCNDTECKTTCKKVSDLSDEEMKTAEGQQLIQKCKTLCEKNDCCTKTDKCEKHDKKSCNKH